MNLTLGTMVIAVLAIIAGVWALVRRIKKGARAEISAEVAEETVDKLRSAGEAQVNAPKSKSDTTKRLREKGL